MSIRDDIADQTPRLRRYARGLLRDPAAADDLVQDCLERALSRTHLFQPGTNLRAWLFTIMHNLHINAINRARRSHGLEGNTPIPENQPGEGGAAPHDRLRLRDLERALHQLPEEQRAVLLLVGMEGMTYAETAAVLDIPAGTVMSRLARGRERLRDLMDEKTSSPGKTLEQET